MKLIIDIDEDIYKMVCITGTFGRFRFNTAKAIKNGILLDDVKAEIDDMSDLIDRDYMLFQIEKAKAENRTFDYDSLIDFIKAFPKEETDDLK